MILWGKSFAQKRKRGRRKKCESALWRLKFNESEWWLYALDQVSLLCLSHTFSLEFHFQAQKNIFVIGEKYFEKFSFLIFLLAVDRCCEITQIQIKSLEILSLQCFNSIHFLLKKFFLSKSVKFSFFASPSFSSSVRVTLFTQHKQVLLLIFILSFF